MNSQQTYEYGEVAGNEPALVANRLKRKPIGSAFLYSYRSPRQPRTLVTSSSERIVYQIADNPQIRRSAFHLVYQRYLEAGLIEPNPFQLRVTPYHLRSSSAVFVGLQRNDVACTVSLIGDEDMGLPLERVYSNEVARKRAEGLRLAEVSCLAFQELGSQSTFWKAYLRLVRIMAQYARFQQVDALLIAVHPRHLQCHTRLMGFEQLGPVTTYPSVRNRLAVACCLQFDRIDQQQPPCYDAIFGKPLSAQQLTRKPMLPAERIELSRIAACTGHADSVAVA
jgi:hypothetical protein